MSRATAAPSTTASAPVVPPTGGPAAAAPAPAIPRSRGALVAALEGHSRPYARARLRRGGRRRRVRPRRRHVPVVLRRARWSALTTTPRRWYGSRASTPTSSGRTPTRQARSSSAASRIRPTSGLRREPGPRRHGHRGRGGRAACRQRGPRSAQRRGPGLRGDHRGGPGLQPSGLPVGAQYLSNASATLRGDILPIVKTLS